MSSPAERLVTELADPDRPTLRARTVAVLAHPDDESLALGGQIDRFADLHLVVVTDGAPTSVADSAAAGCDTVEEYARLRRCELAAALRIARLDPRRLTRLDVPDQGVVERLPALIARLRPLLADAEIVLTHALEGGHPDHDALAVAVRLALGDRRRSAVVEMPFYRAGSDGGWLRQDLGAASTPSCLVSLRNQDCERKRRMLATYHSQRRVLAAFDTASESFRVGPPINPREPAQRRRSPLGADGLARCRHVAAVCGCSRRGAAMALTVLSVAYPLAAVTPGTSGGAEQILSLLDRAIVAAGHRSVVVACAGSRVAGDLVAFDHEADVLDEVAQARARQRCRSAIRSVLAATQVDLVHLHGVDFAAYLPPLGPPALVTLHLPPSWYPPEALRTTRPRTWFNAVSTSQLATCPADMRLVGAIANGIDLDAFAGRHARRRFACSLAGSARRRGPISRSRRRGSPACRCSSRASGSPIRRTSPISRNASVPHSARTCAGWVR